MTRRTSEKYEKYNSTCLVLSSVESIKLALSCIRQYGDLGTHCDYNTFICAVSKASNVSLVRQSES